MYFKKMESAAPKILNANLKNALTENANLKHILQKMYLIFTRSPVLTIIQLQEFRELY